MSTCPFKRPSLFIGVSTLVGLTDTFSSPLTVQVSPGTHRLGANVRFMDVSLASELAIPTQPLSIPMGVRALDGRSISRVTHYTTPINLQVSGNHSEAIQFLLIKSPHFPVILGSLGSCDTIASLTGLLVPSWAGVRSATPIA